MTKVLYISNLRLPTEKAYGIQVTKMCEAFSAGAEVELVFPYRKNPIAEDIFQYYSVKNTFRVKRLPAFDLYFPGYLDKIAVLIKSLFSAIGLVFYALFSGADIIYSRDEVPLFLLSFFKKNIIFEAHRFSSKRKFIYDRFKKRGIRLVVISEAIRKDLISLGFDGNNILTAHDGVDVNAFNINASKAESRKKTNLPLEAKIIMYTGHLFDWKGSDVLLEAAQKFKIQNSKFKILFIFVGGTEHDIKKFREKAWGSGSVLILGHKPHKEIPLYLKAADVLVLPNSAKDKISSYTSPLKLFEYMASRRPIVASNLPVITEILNDNNSILVKSDDSEDLAGGIGKIINDENLSVQLADKAFQDVQQYTWQKRAEKIINFIKHE